MSTDTIAAVPAETGEAAVLARWRRRIATHEAGHAVACWWHGAHRMIDDNWPIGVVVIRQHPDEPFEIDGRPHNADGTCSFKELLWHNDTLTGVTDRAHRRWILRCLMAKLTMAYAGPIAEAALAGETWDSEFDWRMDEDDIDEESRDLRTIDRLIPRLGRRWRLHLDHAWARAAAIVETHRPHIDAIADALIARGRLDGEEVFEICDRIDRGAGALPAALSQAA